jgi:hypothetical protein
MKRTSLTLTVATLFTLAASAQIKKGAILIGGQISFGNSKTDYHSTRPDQKYSSAYYNISAGTAVKENTVIGLYAGYGYFRYDDINNVYQTVKNDNYSFGVFLRQYKKLAKDFYLFGELGAGYTGSNRSETTTPPVTTTKYTQNGGNLYLTPGIAYRVYKKLQVELLVPQVAGVSYSTAKTTGVSTNTTEHYFSFNTNLNSSLLSNLGLGFRFIL